MKTRIGDIIQKITWKHWIIFLLLSQAIYIFMLGRAIPDIQQEAGGLKVFDMMNFGYSYDYADRFLSELSPNGYRMYKFVQIPLDMLFPVLNFFTAILTFVLLKRVYLKLGGRGIRQKYFLFTILLLLLPFAGMLSDYLENIMVFIMLSSKTAISEEFIQAGSIFTVIKSLSIAVFYSICLMMCIAIGIRWIRIKFTRRKINA